jgi:hypothetical protein
MLMRSMFSCIEMDSALILFSVSVHGHIQRLYYEFCYCRAVEELMKFHILRLSLVIIAIFYGSLPT